MTTKRTKTMTTKTIAELVAAAERCLAELRTLGRRNKARRAAVQARYADLGRQIRQAFAQQAPSHTRGDRTMMTNTTKNAHRRLKPGTLVVGIEDGEPGRIVQVCMFRRNGVDARSYLVDTAYGREVWEVGELFVPEQQD